MMFDPDGSRLIILLDSNPIKNYEFVSLLKGVRHQEWGKINIEMEEIAIKDANELTLKFETFHGDDPYTLQIKDLKIEG